MSIPSGSVGGALIPGRLERFAASINEPEDHVLNKSAREMVTFRNVLYVGVATMSFAAKVIFSSNKGSIPKVIFGIGAYLAVVGGANLVEQVKGLTLNPQNHKSRVEMF